MNIIQLKNVSKKYNKDFVIKDLSLSIKKGEVVSIIGPSGAGKSTLLRMINFLEVPTSGEILIENQKIYYSANKAGYLSLPTRFKISKMRKRVGMVFQQFNLWSHKTVLENIITGPRVVNKEEKHAAKLYAEELLKKVGLLEKKDEYPIMLSGGQQQRVAIARALAMKPSVILFDEPTSALDPEMVGEVLRIIEDLAHEGLTLIIVTHEMNFARRVSDRIIYMENGAITFEGTATEVFDTNKYPRIHNFVEHLTY